MKSIYREARMSKARTRMSDVNHVFKPPGLPGGHLVVGFTLAVIFRAIGRYIYWEMVFRYSKIDHGI
jgi:hypothetical protein